jgi:hypothetical protein
MAKSELFGASGVTGGDAKETGPAPTLFCARTVNVYDVASTNPVTMHLVAEVVH